MLIGFMNGKELNFVRQLKKEIVPKKFGKARLETDILSRHYLEDLKSEAFEKVPKLSADGINVDIEVLGCQYAVPHDDSVFDDTFFLNLVLEGDHEFRDAKCEKDFLLEEGTFFVVDPMVVHWAFPRNFPRSKKRLVILQWLLPRSSARRLALKVMKEMNAVPPPRNFCLDKRFKSWVAK